MQSAGKYYSQIGEKNYEQKKRKQNKGVYRCREIVVVAGHYLTDESGNVMANAIVMLRYMFELFIVVCQIVLLLVGSGHFEN